MFLSASFSSCQHPSPQKKVEFNNQEQPFTWTWFIFFVETPEWHFPTWRTWVWYCFTKACQHQISLVGSDLGPDWTKDFWFCQEKSCVGLVKRIWWKVCLPSQSESWIVSGDKGKWNVAKHQKYWVKFWKTCSFVTYSQFKKLEVFCDFRDGNLHF